MIDPVPKPISERVLNEIGRPEDRYSLVFHAKTDPEYLKAARSRYWDTPDEWAVLRMDDADEGLITYAKFGNEWKIPWSKRGLVRIFLELLGVTLPMPTVREED